MCGSKLIPKNKEERLMKISSICEICRFNFIMLIAVEGKLLRRKFSYPKVIQIFT